MIKVICVCNYYLPGFKGGGPIRTVANMRKMLHEDVDISIFTRDHDLSSDRKYTAIQSNCWSDTVDGPIFYASPEKFNATGLKEAIDGQGYEILYLNSFFSYRGSIEIYHCFKNKLGSLQILLAPRGEFSIGALKLKRFKKRAYLQFCRLFGYYRDISWHASSLNEHADILRQFPSADGRIYIAEDPVDIVKFPYKISSNFKHTSCQLRISFVSRISPMKNLDGLLRILATTNRVVELDIYGPIEDIKYWRECQKLIELLPPTASVNYNGTIEPESVSTVFANYDLFVFPTHGENFGHVIFEALRAGTPVVVSDQTPWRPDGSGAISCLSLKEPLAWSEHLNTAADRSDGEKLRLRQAARAYAENFAKNSGIVEKNLLMFKAVSGQCVSMPDNLVSSFE